ncbi:MULTISPECIES: restriction endonuclease [unclassified Bradyrhizobium]|uniref:restriction endonuclease n=1 Tax=unclassified Bradyrhizobium TaxID=2631580 RepID=UPI002916D5D3|nr:MULTISPECIES: restriction endonuclease [unclassified Bradyrhizobium]
MKKPFKELEELVAKIQAQLAPNAKVQHNVLLEGRQSKRKRQIDILVEQKIGQYQINIIIECKDYKKPVNVKGVEEFYGLFEDVGAQKGVLVCPKGFTKSAKARADGYQIDLYSPFDTGAHKWQVKATIPAICDFRSARMSFGVVMNKPFPFKIPQDFYSAVVAFDADGNELGTPLAVAMQRWNDGDFPFSRGDHKGLDIFSSREVMMDNGYGTRVPIEMSVSLMVVQKLYFGQLPLSRVSGFKDEMTGKVITNAFEFGMLDPEEVETTWLPIEDASKAPIHPVITMQGLIAWG